MVSGIYPPETGGPSKFVETFIQWGQRNKLHVDCISLTDNKTQKFYDGTSQITLITRRHSLIVRFILTIVSISRKMLSGYTLIANGLFLEIWFAHLLTRKSYVCKVPGDIVWERARNTKYTELGIDGFQQVQLGPKYKMFRFLFSQSLKAASLVIVPSSHLRSLCIGWGIEPEKIHLVHNSVDTNVFFPLSHNKHYDVVVVNRLVAWKHVDKVIEACLQLKLSLLVIGDGPERESLERLAGKSNTAAFLGEKSQQEIPRIINQARCFVLNSSFEATSYALLEARSAGLFCIANAGTGSAEIIKHMVDGVLCGSTGVSLADALALFKNDTEFVESASKLSREDALNRFDLNRNYKEIFQLSRMSK